MQEFFGPGLWQNIVGGFVAALLIALYDGWRNRSKHKAINELIAIMDKAIQHRNNGGRRQFGNADEWIEKAKQIENDAYEAAKKVSPAAGSLIQSLDLVPPYDPHDQVERYISILTTVIERIRGIMEQNAAV